MEIAPKFTAQDWEELDLSSPDSFDWDKAIASLQSRINERYIEPVDLLISHESGKHYSERRFGFTIIAIDCLLIETLKSFIDGSNETKRGDGCKVFVEYLIQAKNLGNHFTPKLAERFYKEYRNGILHQAQTKNGARIWSEFEVVSEVDGSMIINRTEFHRLLKEDFNHYISMLKSDEHEDLRQNFISKMNFIAKL